ncbi:MAG: hypothetical protein GY779_00230, partial [Gammaproteobacteria bacterium]|nr:hypothetical protein [Gammaproteobacteria bacterium]
TNPGTSGQYTVSDGTSTWGPFDYGSNETISGLPADGNDITLTFSDVDDISCNEATVVNVASCSDLCLLSIDESTVGTCNDNGTDTDASDDTFEVTVNASAINPGASNQFSVTDGTTTWGPFDYGTGGVIIDLPADGNIISLSFEDVDDNACNATVDVSQLPCSSACTFAIDEAAVDPCNDNGTGTDPSDDTFEVTVNATAINPGASNQFSVTDGTTTWGPFDYGVGGMVTDLPANSTNITLTFTDLDDLVCSSAIEVSQNPCSECNLQIDAGPEQFINCSTLSTQLFGTSNEAAFFEWTGPGINVSNQNQEQPMVDLPGLYTLTVSNLSTGCIETDEVLVELMDDVPVAVASTPEIITCKTTSLELNSNGSSTGSNIVYTWSGPDPNIDVNASNPEITIPGNYILLVSDTTNNCSAVDTVAVGINVDPPVATINLTGSLSCNTTSAVIDGLDSSVGDSIQYQWYFEGQMIPGADQISTTINQTGEYTFVVLNIINGCDAADSLIAVDDMTYPIASAGEAELLTCATDSVQLNGSGSTNAS